MFAIDLAQMLEDVFESIDWGNLLPSAIALAAVPILYRIASLLAHRSVQNELDNLRAQLKNKDRELANANAAVGNAEAKANAQAIDLATLRQKVEHREETIRQLQEAHNGAKAESEKILEAARKYQAEARHLRPIKAAHDALAAEHANSQKRANDLTAEVATQTAEAERFRKEIEGRDRQLKRLWRLKGKLVDKAARQKRPPFKSLVSRGRAIVSVLNLKGGVGKTTVTANLGAALARQGYRVLFVDLDLQESLTGLILNQTQITQAFDDRRMVQDFLMRAATRERGRSGNRLVTKLTPYIIPVPSAVGVPGSLSIVPASDDLAYAELNLTLGWLLRQGERDARFLLRKALHLIGENAAYDIVLIDCPPILNISCVNALAASDYLLIPTVLSNKAVERVPILVETVNRLEFLSNVNESLELLGVVANRTRQAEPTGKEAAVWGTLPQYLRYAKGDPAGKIFETVIAQDAEISASEHESGQPRPGGRAVEMFDRLAAEVERKLPDACRRTQPDDPRGGGQA